MARRKPGPRTKSGRLSRAYKSPELRDKGTPEAQNKRAYLINGSDPQLAATASGILLANGFLTPGQHVAALRYARWHALLYGKPWSVVCPLAWHLPTQGTEPPEASLCWRWRPSSGSWRALGTTAVAADAAVSGRVGEATRAVPAMICGW